MTFVIVTDLYSNLHQMIVYKNANYACYPLPQLHIAIPQQLIHGHFEGTAVRVGLIVTVVGEKEGREYFCNECLYSKQHSGVPTVMIVNLDQ